MVEVLDARMARGGAVPLQVLEDLLLQGHALNHSLAKTAAEEPRDTRSQSQPGKNSSRGTNSHTLSATAWQRSSRANT